MSGPLPARLSTGEPAACRAVLLPASMKLLGEWNWYLPRALERLPHAAVETPPARDAV